MANIKTLQMWDNICADSRISISKSFLGLKTTATYVPTQSIIDVKIIEYTQKDGERLQRILQTQQDKLSEAISDFHPKEVYNGNYLLEVCKSRDGQFVGLLLKQFSQITYEPVTEALFFEGDRAKVLSNLFQ